VQQALVPLVLLASSFFPASGKAIGSLTNLFVVGDSYSDSGNAYAITGGNFPPSHYFQGRASNGPVAVEYLWNHFNPGDTSFRASAQGGTNYAINGATTGVENFLSVWPVTAPTVGSLFEDKGNFSQLNVFRGAYPGAAGFDPETSLFVVWLFPNDLFYHRDTGGSTTGLGDSSGSFDGTQGGPPKIGFADVISNGISNIVGTIRDLAATNGIRNFLVPNLGDIGKTPEVIGTPQESFLSMLSNDFNTGLEAALTDLDQELSDASITQFQVDDLFAEIQANKEAFGFENVTEKCVENLSNGRCNPSTWLFWDGSHTTAAGHAVIGDRFYKAVHSVPGPLPAFGAVAAFGWSRRLRRRIAGRSVLLDSPAVVPSGLTFRLQAEQRGPQDQHGPQHGPRADRFPEQPPAPHPGKHHLRIADGRGSSRR
jgi:phospholipase/lecithinase/hemolysin